MSTTPVEREKSCPGSRPAGSRSARGRDQPRRQGGQGGRRFSFTALVVIEDKSTASASATGKPARYRSRSRKPSTTKKNLFTIPKHGTTITHPIVGKFGAARVMLRPASEGTGVIAGGGVRAVLELGGIRDILAKSLGTTNPINMLKATIKGLQPLRRRRGRSRAAVSRSARCCQVGRRAGVEAETAASTPSPPSTLPRRPKRARRPRVAKVKIRQVRARSAR